MDDYRIIGLFEKPPEALFAFTQVIHCPFALNGDGRLSRMEAINAKSVNESALGAAKVKLAKLKWALSNIEEPEFGLCLDCGEPIPVGRILLLPEATTCVGCAAKNE